MNHLSFGRKRGRGLGNKNTIFRVLFESLTDLFSIDGSVREKSLAPVSRGDAVASRVVAGDRVAARQALGFVLRQSGQPS
jgi:hypothetical protein